MILALLSSFAVAALAPWLHRLSGRSTGWLLGVLPSALFLYFLSFLGDTATGRVIVFSHEWAPALGIALSFVLDGLSLLFALLITGVGALVLVYTNGYLAGHPHLGRFYAWILLFMASMLGLVLADNLITLFVFWELTSISSYFLIGFDHHRESACTAALQALLVTGAGGLALLAGFLLLGHVGGSLEISALSGRSGPIRTHPLYSPILLLVLAGAFTKSAQVPFHFWLPGAMEAPTPVSAYLHSATMVKAGIYLLARVSPVLGGTDLWFYALTATGTTTMVVGAYLALRHTDLKLILAYLTVSALGILVLFLGLGTPDAVFGAMAFLLAHALYKGALFLVAGIVDHQAGSRDVERLGALRSAMPITATVAALAALSLAAFPLTLGFLGKEVLVDVSLQATEGALIRTAALLLASAIFVATAGIVAVRPFFGTAPTTREKDPQEAIPSLWLGPLLLASLGVLFGGWPSLIDDPLVRPAARAFAGESPTLALTLWHGVNLPLVLSTVSFACGIALYLGRRKVHAMAVRTQIRAGWGPQAWYGQLLAGMNRLADRQTKLLQNGYLRFYLTIVVVTTLGLAGSPLFGAAGSADLATTLDLRFYEWIVAGLIPIGAVTAITARTRLGAVAALGVVGYSVGSIFVLFGAPDLAMTQFMVETLTVILLVLVFYHLRLFTAVSRWPAVVRDAAMASAFGGLVTVIVLVGFGLQLHPKISEYFFTHSWSLAHGRNVVNVLLVDFRAFDTLGEITVLAVAGAGVYALLKLKPGGESG
jgi:multicomponent Na+:H+ antiporter subunit A